MENYLKRTVDPINSANESSKNYVILRGQKFFNGNLKHKIGWCDNTNRNLLSGCDKCSDGCLNCYSYELTKRCQKWHPEKYRNGFKVTTHPDVLLKPFSKGYREYHFVCSMSDLFHKDVPDSFIHNAFDVFNKNPQHTFIILTKRPERLAEIAPYLIWTGNIWCGVSVESNRYYSRIDLLRTIPAKIRFISAEPLLSSLKDADFSGIDLVICQPESGNKARPADTDWIREIRDKCAEAEICFFFKNFGGKNPKKSGDLLDGNRHKQLPIPLEEIKNRKRNNRNKNNKNKKIIIMSNLNSTVTPAVAAGITPNNNNVINNQPRQSAQPVIMEEDNRNFDSGLVSVMSANNRIDAARRRPKPKMLAGELFFEREIAIMYSDMNAGKTILAVQIANSITKGIPLAPFSLEANQQKVLYYDLELSDTQFENRYSDNYTNHVSWNNDLLIGSLDCCPKLPADFNSYEDYFFDCFENSLIKSEARVVIIDNITTINVRINDIISFIDRLNKLKREYGISILLLAHTPKRNLLRPISENDLRGTKILMDLCDSAFAIGKSTQGNDIRYIKQIKQRNCEQV
jgi:protein gp37